MRICDLTTGATRLQRATKELHESWCEVQKHWNDARSREFEKRYLQPISPRLRLVLASLHQLQELLDKAQRDCQDEMHHLAD